jgi:protein SCO1/2
VSLNDSHPSKKIDADRPRRRNWPLLALALVVITAVGALAIRQYSGIAAGVAAETAAGENKMKIGGPFTLVDQNGQTVTEADYAGRWLLVYFGFTYCPDVCPTSLTRNVDAIDLLGEKGEMVTPVLISIDPQRDTPEKLKEYVNLFHPRMVGLTGTPQQTASVAKEYRVFYMKSPGNTPDTYLVDHSSLTYLIGPDGEFVEFFGHSTSAEEMANRIKQHL